MIHEIDVVHTLANRFACFLAVADPFKVQTFAESLAQHFAREEMIILIVFNEKDGWRFRHSPLNLAKML